MKNACLFIEQGMKITRTMYWEIIETAWRSQQFYSCITKQQLLLNTAKCAVNCFWKQYTMILSCKK